VTDAVAAANEEQRAEHEILVPRPHRS